MTSWDIVASVAFNGATPLDRISVYRAMSAAPGSGPITITSSVTVSNCQWIVSQWDGVDHGGPNGAGAIVQASRPRAARQRADGDADGVRGRHERRLRRVRRRERDGRRHRRRRLHTIDQQPTGEGTTGDLFAEWAVNQPAVTASWTSKSGGVVALEIRSKVLSR